MPQPILDARPTLGTFMRRSLLLLASCLFGAAACAPDSTPVRSIAPGEPSLIVNGAFDLEHGRAVIRDGELTVVLPKRPDRRGQPHRIAVESQSA